MPAPSEQRHPAFAKKPSEADDTDFTRAWERKHGHRWVLHRGYYYPIGTVIEQREGPRVRYGRRRW